MVTGQHVLTNEPNVVIILDAYAFVHFQVTVHEGCKNHRKLLNWVHFYPLEAAPAHRLAACPPKPWRRRANRPLRGWAVMGCVPLIIKC